MNKDLTIRNSTAEFLIFTTQSKEDSIEVKYADENVWLSQKMMAKLFDVDVRTINEHIQNIYNTHELDKTSTIRKFRIVQKEGDRKISREVDFYNLDAIISVGYRVNSEKATQFRQWATKIIKDFAVKCYVLDKERLKNGSFLNQNYFDEVLTKLIFSIKSSSEVV